LFARPTVLTRWSRPLLGVGLGGIVACGGDDSAATPPPPEPSGPVEPIYPLEVTNLADGAGLDVATIGERTRATVAADFDGDGHLDLFIGNPGDRSHILRNVTEGGTPRFELLQELSDGHLSWTAAAADFDNDGDVDLFVGGGGNECQDVDQLWVNQRIPSGDTTFVESRLAYGITTANDEVATSGVRWADVDNDGLLDLYLGRNRNPRCGSTAARTDVNELWLNKGDHFEEVATSVGLTFPGSTRHPTFFDVDNDGDLDLFDSNTASPNRFFLNGLAETGGLIFGMVDPLDHGGDADLLQPLNAFASCAADLDNDGWEDLVVFNRETEECSLAGIGPEERGYVHRIYRNLQGRGFDDVSEEAGVYLLVDDVTGGVMGCQLGDLNGDGGIDIYVGNGGPFQTAEDDLFFGTPYGMAFEDVSHLVRGVDDGGPYRTHGTVISDLTGDGQPDLFVGNGGPSALDAMEEPNRLLHFTWPDDTRFLTVELHGDGERVNRDAVGAKAELVLTRADGTTRSLHRRVSAGNCFSADPGRALSFGLGGDTPTELRITWPDGHTEQHAVAADARRLDIDR